MLESLTPAQNVVKVVLDELTALLGESALDGLLVEQEGTVRKVPVTGLFVAVGHQPDNGIFAGLMELDTAGYALSGEDCLTASAGVFVAGDCRVKSVRQLTTAAADGAVAALAACRWLDRT